MKTRPLPQLDLARIASLPRDQKRHELEKMKFGRPPYSYNPVRQSILDLLNISGPLAPLPRTPWTLIADEIRRCGGSAEQIKANLEVGEGIYDFATSHDIVGRRHEFFPLSIGLSERVVYWSPVVMSINGRPVVPFFDPRRTKGLTAKSICILGHA